MRGLCCCDNISEEAVGRALGRVSFPEFAQGVHHWEEKKNCSTHVQKKSPVGRLLKERGGHRDRSSLKVPRHNTSGVPKACEASGNGRANECRYCYRRCSETANGGRYWVEVFAVDSGTMREDGIKSSFTPQR